MSSHNEIISFVPKRNGQCFLGVEDNTNSDYAVVTFTSTIFLIQPNDNKIIKSYSCTQGKKNTSQAIYVSDDNEFVVVQNKKVLKYFNSDLEEAETYTLKHNIHTLLRSKNHNPLVMLEDGSLHHLHHVLEDPGKITLDSSLKLKIDEIIFVASFNADDSNILVSSICRVGKKYKVLISTIHREENKVSYLDKEISYEEFTLQCATFFKDSLKPTITTLWSDGSICQVHIDNSGNKELNAQIIKITSLEIDENPSMTALSCDQVAVSCKDTNIKIIDLKFGTILRQIKSNDKVLQMTTMRDYVVLDMPGALRKLPFTSSPVTLASAILGQKKSETICQTQCAEWKNKPAQNSFLTDSDNELIEIILKTQQETNFDKTWTKFSKGRSLDFWKQFSRSNVMKEILKRFDVETGKKKFWPRFTVLKIISNGFVNGRWCDGIFRQIFATEDWDMLLECLKVLNEVPEHTMISCLTHISKAKISDPTKDTETSETTEIPKQLHSCINEILQLSYTENTLRKELSKIPFESVLKIVLYFTSLLEEMSLSSQSPSLDQVICWLCMIIDAHLSEMLMLEDCWPTIFKLQEVAKAQGALFNELTVVDRLLTQIQCKLPTSKKSRKSLYTVEIMEF